MYALFRCFEAVLRLLPMEVVWYVGRGIGFAGYDLLGWHVLILRACLRQKGQTEFLQKRVVLVRRRLEQHVHAGEVVGGDVLSMGGAGAADSRVEGGNPIAAGGVGEMMGWHIGVGTAHWFAPPLPPNRTGGFPASGSPIDEC